MLLSAVKLGQGEKCDDGDERRRGDPGEAISFSLALDLSWTLAVVMNSEAFVLSTPPARPSFLCGSRPVSRWRVFR